MNETYIIIFALLLLIGILSIAFPVIQKKALLGDLTGLYYYKKINNGSELFVQYTDNDSIKRYRKATKEDKATLKTLGIL